MMIYILIAISILFIGTGFIVTEKNAKNLLSGYNELSEEEQQKFDLKGYLSFFKKFHIFLGLSFLIGGLVLNLFVSETSGLLFFCIYPILAYTYFVLKSSKFSSKARKQWHKIFSFTILISILGLLIWIFSDGFIEDKFICKATEIEITGSYGEILPKSEIKSIELIEKLPKIVRKTNGFAAGSVRKGYFKTENGEIVKLILNSKWTPIIVITRNNGGKIYYSTENGKNKELVNKLKEKLKLE